ncbi:envelope integrity protein Cei [Nocardia farcinica]|uniref:envelope integrity protein Cei n=1 Tax=Nocardia farcinica TaxID=37329 RepID=UPI000761A31F|nr:envelope integrity protein Cei [Nocardia farcinica]AXK89888.1 LytR family transcriptional regulator [Nocardia farcinica]MBF6229970.1 envelope integrity protein Cei [Nocardia farcinica]MBF6262033.1 envelope integrity protein Cei [Nocardia farcinica]MBF6280572.1 envelope integrity protein Cei [Nocardia farcinica]MBF6291574.1 envelope integrity protein Cei [Nocardia farcinica]
MVSLITEGSATDPQGRPYPRRRPRPWLVMLGVLALICSIVWIKALTTEDADTAAMACNSPSPAAEPGAEPAPALGQRVGASRLEEVEPAPLAESKVRVLNANNQRGQAADVASRLGDLGFGSAPGTQYGNDPIYVNGDLECMGQIRFGVNGRPAAATVQLVVPCAELIEDQRTDETVDLVLGSLFRGIQPSNDAEEVLRSLKNPAPGDSPKIDIDLLEAARTARC